MSYREITAKDRYSWEVGYAGNLRKGVLAKLSALKKRGSTALIRQKIAEKYVCNTGNNTYPSDGRPFALQVLHEKTAAYSDR